MNKPLDYKDREEVFQRKIKYDGYGTSEDKKLISIIQNITKLCLNKDDLAETILKDISHALRSAKKRTELLELYNRTQLQLEKCIQSMQFSYKLKQVICLPDCHSTELSIAALEETKQKLQDKLEQQQKTKEELFDKCRSLSTIIDKMDVDL